MKAKLTLSLFLAGLVNVVVMASSPGISGAEQESTYWNAVKLYQDENYTQSLLLFQHLLLKNPDSVELNYYAGMCYFNLNRPKIAKWHFSIASVDNCCRLKILLLTRSDNESSDFTTYNN